MVKVMVRASVKGSKIFNFSFIFVPLYHLNNMHVGSIKIFKYTSKSVAYNGFIYFLRKIFNSMIVGFQKRKAVSCNC